MYAMPPCAETATPFPGANRLLVDLRALRENYRSLAARTAAECAGVVKADAYGFGLAPVARALAEAGCRTFFTAFTGEAAALRALLPGVSIYVLSPLVESEGPRLLGERLVPCIYDAAGAAAWSALGDAAGSSVPAALHLETGINRLGMSEAEARALGGDGAEPPAPLPPAAGRSAAGRGARGPGPASRSAPAAPGSGSGARSGRIDVRMVMSHLASGDEPRAAMNRVQLARFRALRRLFPRARASLANSAGLLLGADYHFDLVRPGVAVYGHDPHYRSGPARVRPVATFEARLAQVKRLRAGETIGYGETFTCPRDMRVGVVLAGYADGVDRRLSPAPGAPPFRVGIGGHRAPLVGRVSMDMSVVDLSEVPEADAPPGATVEIFGPRVPVEAMAEGAGTIPYEIFTGIGRRVPRHYTGGGDGAASPPAEKRAPSTPGPARAARPST